MMLIISCMQFSSSPSMSNTDGKRKMSQQTAATRKRSKLIEFGKDPQILLWGAKSTPHPRPPSPTFFTLK